MKKKILLSLCVLLLLSGCKNAKLKDGDTDLVTFKDKDPIDTKVLYEEMKDIYGAETLTNLVDTYLLDGMYEETQEEKEYVREQIKSAEEAAKNMGVTTDIYLLYYYGVASEDLYKKQLKLEYRRGLYATDYAKENVTDTEIKDYYEKEVIGDIEASQILITVDTSKAKTDDEKKDATEAAKKKANEVIKKLKDGEDFATLAQKYSDDSLTASKGGSLGKVNRDDVSTTIINALIALEDGSYTKSPIEDTTGFYILYRTSQDEKPELDDTLKDEIISTIAEETAANTSNYKLIAMKALREKNEMDINDSSLKKAFDKLHENY